jgi:hypothetical protein
MLKNNKMGRRTRDVKPKTFLTVSRKIEENIKQIGKVQEVGSII